MTPSQTLSTNLQCAALRRANRLRNQAIDMLLDSAAAGVRRSARRLAASFRRHEVLRRMG
jgi:hypothetical protein